ncbi:hypothetical protein B0293_36810 [Amycolatopsis azurea DSM 43854]|uniref:Putative RNA polymerase sigma factor n=1 Tax=Amycolatopsis azurea DSM 43854 TaxID=1238180 RepID=M2PNC8_9PSEU|nr:putative RNA polymerase sigma factor [Amycolatopsis azurea DSM 43854]OOC01872.1 hypothetical protein B0293_36810 [Amycolatopsis azurea DSM 43854]
MVLVRCVVSRCWRGRVPKRAASTDAAQRGNIRDSRALAGWLITTARREAQRLRQGAARTGPLTDDLVETAISGDPAPDEQTPRAERDRRLWRAFVKLPKRDQELLRLLVVNKASHKEVTEAMGLSVGSVGPTRGRAVGRLRKLLEDEEATHPVDAALVDRLRAAGFTGPEFDQFAELVIAHAQPLVQTWITTGDIFRKATHAGHTMLRMPDHLTAGEAGGLAQDTVFAAWTTLKCVYMAIMSLDPTGTGRKRWTMRWKPALNAFEIAFDGRLAAGRK